jgi:hypothetical protein
MLQKEITLSPTTIKIDGRVLAFDNLTDLAVGALGPSFGYGKCTGEIDRLKRDMRDGYVVVSDYLGIPIQDHDFIPFALAACREERRARPYVRRLGKGNYTFRRGPVPGIRCFRGGGGMFRHPRTLNEMRNAVACDGDTELRDLGVRVRGRRKKASLPTLWDDPWRNDRDDKNWKRQRRAQYRDAVPSAKRIP